MNLGALHTAWRIPLCFSLAGTAVLLVLTSLILDGGRVARVAGGTAIAIWIINVALIGRNKRKPNRSDLLFVRYGWLLIPAAAMVAGFRP